MNNKRVIVILAVVALIGAGGVASLYFLSIGRGSTSSTALPAGCTKPADGFLIIASHLGWNDSEEHGTGITAGAVWPKISVTQGQTVDITVCNTDVQAHSFQVGYYEQNEANTMIPHQVLHVTFVATKAGTFQIYCEIECSIHIYMQGGQLIVLPA